MFRSDIDFTREIGFQIAIRSDQDLETLAALGQAPLHPPAAKQHRDANLRYRRENVGLFEYRPALEGFPLRRLLSATRGNPHLTDAGLLAVVLIVWHCKSPDRRRTTRENSGRFLDGGPAKSSPG